MKKKPTVWLARRPWGNYIIEIGQRKPRDERHTYGLDICDDGFHKIAPKSCHLKPGGGPIKIDVKITEVKK